MTASVLFILIFVSSLYSRLGLTRASLIYPVNFLLIFSGLSVFFNIYMAAAGQFMIRLVQRAVAGPVTKIFFLIVPREISAWSQVFVRGSVVKLGMMAGSLGMLLLKPVLAPWQFSIPAIGLAVFLILETIIFGRRYKASLKQAIIGENVDYDLFQAVEESPRTAVFSEPSAAPVVLSPTGREEIEPENDEIPVETALKMLEDPEPETRAAAASTFKKINYPPAAGPLIGLLDDREIVRRAAMEALAAYPPNILPLLETSLDRLSRRGQKGVLEVIRLANMKNFELRPYLGKLVAGAYHNLMAIQAIRDFAGTGAGALLLEHLEENNDELLELAFQALWVKYADMRLVYKALKSREGPVAVEMVECTIDPGEARYIVPLIDALPLDEKLKTGREVLPLTRDMTAERCVAYLGNSQDPVIRLLTAYFLGETDPGDFSITLQELVKDREKDVREMAAHALKRLKSEETAMPEIMENMLFLKKCLIFDGMGAGELRAIASIAVTQTYAPGETVIEEGFEDSSLHLIREGRVSVIKKGGGREQPLKSLGPGGFFGELWLFSSGLAEETYLAVEPTAIVVLNRVHFEEIMKIYPQIGVNLCTFLAIRLELLQSRIGSS